MNAPLAFPRPGRGRFPLQAGMLAFLTLFSALVASPAPAAEEEESEAAAVPEVVSYYKDVRPILQQHCQGCHQPAKPSGSYIMTTHAALLEPGDSEEPGVVPGKPADSLLVYMIDGDDPAMPKEAEPLAARDIEIIKKWIEQGAEDDTPASSAPLIDMQHPPKYEQPPVITSLDFSPDGKLLAVSGYHEVLLHKADGSGIVARLVGLSERIESAEFSPDGKRLAVTGGSPSRFGELQVWDVAARELTLSKTVSYDTIYGASWSPDGKLIAFGCPDNTLRAVDAETGEQVLFQGAHSDWVLDTVFSKEGTHLVSVSRDRSMKLTEVKTERFVDNITSITPGALKGGILTVDRHPTKDELAVGGADGVPKLYQMFRTKDRKIGDDYNRLRTYPSLPGRVFSVKFSADGKYLAAGSSHNGSGEVRVFETDTGKQVSSFEGQPSSVYTVAFSPDGTRVASAGFDGKIRLNDPQTGKLVAEFMAVPLVPGGDQTASK